jgi:hypothetical protein
MGSSNQMKLTCYFTGGTARMGAQFAINTLHLCADSIDRNNQSVSNVRV